jgi:hypothetical protein
MRSQSEHDLPQAVAEAKTMAFILSGLSMLICLRISTTIVIHSSPIMTFYCSFPSPVVVYISVGDDDVMLYIFMIGTRD